MKGFAMPVLLSLSIDPSDEVHLSDLISFVEKAKTIGAHRSETVTIVQDGAGTSLVIEVTAGLADAVDTALALHIDANTDTETLPDGRVRCSDKWTERGTAGAHVHRCRYGRLSDPVHSNVAHMCDTCSATWPIFEGTNR